MKIIDTPLSHYVNMLNQGEQFKFLRFGDGEWICFGGFNTRIGKGEHHVWGELTRDIKHIVGNPKDGYYNGLQPLSLTIQKLIPFIPDRDWHNSDVFHLASLAGELYPLVEALSKKNVVIISREDKRAIPFAYSDFIAVRDTDSYYDKNMVIKKLDKYPCDTVFLFAASRLSVPAIYHSREDCTMIDMGSLFDPYVGIHSRVYHSKITSEIIRKNLTGK